MLTKLINSYHGNFDAVALGDDILDDDNKIELLLEKIYNGEINNIAFVKYGANDKINFEDNKMRSIIQSTELYDCKEYKWFVVFTKKPKL